MSTRKYSTAKFLDYIGNRCVIEVNNETGQERRYVDRTLLMFRLAVFAEHLGKGQLDLYRELNSMGSIRGKYYTMIMGRPPEDYEIHYFEKEIDGKVLNSRELLLQREPRKIIDPRDIVIYTDERGNEAWKEQYKPKTESTNPRNRKSSIRNRT